jgi:hypothetical protein
MTISVQTLKGDGKHFEAGALAARNGQARDYGCHYGLTTNRAAAQSAFCAGYDIAKQAQRHANRTGDSVAVFNLNRVGAPMYVIRAADSFAAERRAVTGVFEPQPETADA